MGLWFVWGCACLRSSAHKNAHFRDLFRHIGPATRTSNPNAFPRYMRRTVEDSIIQRSKPHQIFDENLRTCKQKYGWFLRFLGEWDGSHAGAPAWFSWSHGGNRLLSELTICCCGAKASPLNCCLFSSFPAVGEAPSVSYWLAMFPR